MKYDISCRMKDLIGNMGIDEPVIEMYSFSRPSRILWNAIYNGFREKGLTDKQAREWLQSKFPRWELDGKLGESLEKLGLELVERIIK